MNRTEQISLMAQMRVPWQEREGTTLSDLYDADLRVQYDEIIKSSAATLIPHPLSGVGYADGVAP